MRQRGADDALVRGQHHRERASPRLVVAVIVDRDPRGDAGIVDDDIEPAEMRGHLSHDSLDLVAIADIEPARRAPSRPPR